MELSAIVVMLVEKYGYFGAFISSFLNSVMVFTPINLDLITMTFSAVLNPFILVLFMGVGSGLGDMSTYIIGRGANDIMEEHKKMRKFIEKGKTLFKKYGAIYLISLGLIPIPFDFAGVIAGSLDYPAKKFLAIAIIAKILRSAVMVFSFKVGFTLITSL